MELTVNQERLQTGQKVQFRLGDIHLPDIQEVLARMTEDTELQGQITLLSDAGDQKAAFAVVEVRGVLMPIIVPATCIKPVENQEEATGDATNRW